MAVFLYKPHRIVPDGSGLQLGSGELLLLGSLILDGATGAVQDRIRHYHITDK